MAVAHDASLREVAVWESAADLLALSNNRFNFQFAKSVLGKNGEVTYNIVWQSKNLAPRFRISWEPIYALNWTLTLPTSGITVTVGGVWQTCALGQVYDLSSVGLWTPSTVPSKPNFMTVGKNNYAYSGQNGIHVVVGVKNSAGGYDVIYVDPTELGLNMSSWYQPQETVKWWYQTGIRTSTMIAGADTPMQTYDISMPNPETGQFYVSTTYIYATGQWINSPNAPPSAAETGVLGLPAPGLTIGGGGGGGSGTVTNPGSGDINSKIISIEKALLRLAVLLSTGGAHVPLAPYRGTIIWPGTTAVAVMEQGGELAANSLSQAGYNATPIVDVATSRTYLDFYMVGSPPEDGVPGRVHLAWLAAYQAVPNIGQQNGGVRDTSGLSHDGAVRGDDGKGKVVGEDGVDAAAATNGAKGGGDAALAVRKAHARAVAAAA